MGVIRHIAGQQVFPDIFLDGVTYHWDFANDCCLVIWQHNDGKNETNQKWNSQHVMQVWPKLWGKPTMSQQNIQSDSTAEKTVKASVHPGPTSLLSLPCHWTRKCTKTVVMAGFTNLKISNTLKILFSLTKTRNNVAYWAISFHVRMSK